MNKDDVVCNEISCPLLWMTVCAGFGLLFGIVFEGGNLQLSMTFGAAIGLAIPVLMYTSKALGKKKNLHPHAITPHAR